MCVLNLKKGGFFVNQGIGDEELPMTTEHVKHYLFDNISLNGGTFYDVYKLLKACPEIKDLISADQSDFVNAVLDSDTFNNWEISGNVNSVQPKIIRAEFKFRPVVYIEEEAKAYLSEYTIVGSEIVAFRMIEKGMFGTPIEEILNTPMFENLEVMEIQKFGKPFSLRKDLKLIDFLRVVSMQVFSVKD